MDYDRTTLPAGYDRGRDHGPEVLALWMRTIAAHLTGKTVTTILDLGCGTGRFTEALAEQFDAEVIGLDPSSRMLEQARAKQRLPRVQYRTGSGEAIPLADASMDLVFLSMSYHHLDDPARAARECRRVLREDGRVIVRTGTVEQIANYPYVDFFQGTTSVLQNILPDRAGLCAVFEAAGFESTGWELVTQTIAPSWTAYADKLSAGGDSVLATLSDETFQEGLAAIRRHRADAAPQPVREPLDLFVFRCDRPTQ